MSKAINEGQAPGAGELEGFRPRSVFAHAAVSDGSADKLYLIGGEVSPSDKDPTLHFLYPVKKGPSALFYGSV